jgi:hypothetical protein
MSAITEASTGGVKLVVGLAGGTASGKTSIANLIVEKVGRDAAMYALSQHHKMQHSPSSTTSSSSTSSSSSAASERMHPVSKVFGSVKKRLLHPFTSSSVSSSFSKSSPDDNVNSAAALEPQMNLPDRVVIRRIAMDSYYKGMA